MSEKVSGKTRLSGGGFFWALLKMNMLPLILLTLVITTFSAIRFAASMNREAQNGLVDLCHTVMTLYDAVYEGDYHIDETGGTAVMMKGEHPLNGNFAIIDSIKMQTGIDVTIFYQDTRMITTIQNSDGVRAIGTKANDTVVKDVLQGGKSHFYASTMVEGVRYFSYYEPIYASDGSCIGMFFLGKPSAEVRRLVRNALMPTIGFCILTMLIVCIATVGFSNKLVSAIRKTESFVETIAKGNLHTEFDTDVLNRKDELGDMGQYLIKMQQSLRNLVEQDTLTGLYNRRSGEQMLRHIHKNYQKDGTPFCVAIGDIDHFKNVNDTYGHECGDVALTEMAAQIQDHMKGRGFVARWGGEEFLLVYDNMGLETAAACIRELMDEIRSRCIIYESTSLKITMTFGLTEGNGGKIEHIVRDADARLYEGKNDGRDRLVYEAALSG